MAYAPLSIPAGMLRNGTEYQNAGRWYDGHLVRWNGGTMRPVGGWVRVTEEKIEGAPRAAFTWRENDLERRAALGTHSHLYIYSSGALFDITPADLVVGRVDSIAGFGYGYGVMGGGVYGAGHAPAGSLDATTWSLDNWGEHLVACSTADGRLLEWTNDVLTPAAPILNAPTNCDALVTTSERHLVALGADGDHRKIMWCSSENNTDWVPTATNSAGSLQLDTTGKVITGKRVRGQALIWTEEELHALQYIGSPFYYGISKIASFCGAISAKAVVEVEVGAAWMSVNQFFLFDGALRPIQCDVVDYIFSDFNWIQRAKVASGHNSHFGEVWWFYPSAGSEEVDRYVIWNYRENHWSTGYLARTCWADSGVFQYPIACDIEGNIYEHECGWLADGKPLLGERFARCGPMEIGAGDRIACARQLIPDEATNGQVQLRFYGRYAPEAEEVEYGPYSLRPVTDVRFTARQVGLRVEGAVDADWRVGKMRLEMVAGGGR